MTIERDKKRGNDDGDRPGVEARVNRRRDESNERYKSSILYESVYMYRYSRDKPRVVRAGNESAIAAMLAR